MNCMPDTSSIKIGTRGSALARAQTRIVIDTLTRRNPGCRFETVVIQTKGDAHLDSPLNRIDDKGLFVREIEQALQTGSIDMAVHSMKDLPTGQPAGLTIGAVCCRDNPRDVFVGRCVQRIGDLARGSTVATGSLRRKAQLLAYRPDLKVVGIRGNVDTRLRKLQEDKLDAVILAAAGLHRLGLLIGDMQLLDYAVMLPAPAQGALGLQVRSNDTPMLQLAAGIDDPVCSDAVIAERAFLHALHGGCHVPVAALCSVENGELLLRGKILSLDGRRSYEDTEPAAPGGAAQAGTVLAERMLAAGGAALLEECREA